MGQTAISLSSGTGNYPSVPHTLPPYGSPREGLASLSTLLAVPPPSSNCVTLIWMPNNYHPDEVIHRSEKNSPRGNLTATDLHCAFVGRMCRNANGCLAVDGCVLVGWFSTGGSWSRMGRRSVLLGSLTIGGNDYATPYVYVIGLEWVWIENKILNFLEIRNDLQTETTSHWHSYDLFTPRWNLTKTKIWCDKHFNRNEWICSDRHKHLHDVRPNFLFHHIAKKTAQPVGCVLLVTCQEHLCWCEQAFRNQALQSQVIWLRKISIRIKFYIHKNKHLFMGL